MVEIVRTRDGRPAIWEWGGGFTNTGLAVVVTGPHGEPLPAAYIRRRGDLACQRHALVPVRPGCAVVEAAHHRGDFRVWVWRVVAGPNGPEVGPKVAEFSEGGWVLNSTAPDPLSVEDQAAWAAAVTAAAEKASCYHCREPHYVLAPRHAETGGR